MSSKNRTYIVSSCWRLLEDLVVLNHYHQSVHSVMPMQYVALVLIGCYAFSWTYIREYGSTLYVGLARDVSPTNTNFRLTFLLTRLQEALYEDLAE